jgi:hypothetical protein
MRTHGVRALLMGGQACVFYGAAEFSRDTDFAILADMANLARLRKALVDLQAAPIAVPPFELKFLRAGHAIHFRCRHPEAFQMRVDVMSKMRGVEPFEKLWRRRTTIQLPDQTICDLLSLPDLVRAKKTQRDKDWPMLRRLVEANYFQYRRNSDSVRVKFWLRELRTPALLIELAQEHERLCRQLIAKRWLLEHALSARAAELERALIAEETAERESDKLYWLPLRRELEKLRHAKKAKKISTNASSL